MKYLRGCRENYLAVNHIDIVLGEYLFKEFKFFVFNLILITSHSYFSFCKPYDNKICIRYVSTSNCAHECIKNVLISVDEK